MSLEFDDRDRESVVRDLRDGDEEVRRLAVERVNVLPSAEAIESLIDCLGDSSWRVRKAAVERLVARSEGAEVADALVGALADGENSGRRNAAIEALIHCGPSALPSLLVASSSDDADVRKQVVDALAGIADSQTRGRLLELLTDPDPNVRAAAAEALGTIGGGGVSEALMRAATREDEDQLVRFSAVHALTALEVPARVSELGTLLDDPVLGPAGLALLGRADDEDEALGVLLKALSSSSRSSRETAMRALLRIIGCAEPDTATSFAERIRAVAASSERLAASAIERLAEADLSLRLILIQFLGIVAAPEAVVPILLAGRDEALSSVALATLESLGEPAEETIDSQWTQLDTESRRDGCLLFGRTDGETGAERLLSALDDPATEVRTAAARSIGQRKLASGLTLLVQRLVAAAAEDDFESEEELAGVTDALIALARPAADFPSGVTERTIALLTASLDGAGENVRLAVARVLGRIGRREDSEIVAFLLKDPSSRVRRASVEALARLEPGTAAEPLRLALADESPSVRIAAARALGASESDRVVDDLERLADDEDARVRAAAVHSVILRFARSMKPKPRDTALRVLDAALGDEAPVALSAVEALSEVGGPDAHRASAVLSRSEPELVRHAIQCIGAHADPAELEALLPLIGHPDWAVRAEAIETVADRGLVAAVPAILRRLETECDDFVRAATLRALKRLESEVG